jgi:hypothetical protein
MGLPHPPGVRRPQDRGPGDRVSSELNCRSTTVTTRHDVCDLRHKCVPTARCSSWE